MAEPCTSETRQEGRKRKRRQRRKRRENIIGALLMDWKSYDEVENILGPYVSQVIDKAHYGGYKSAREVFEDYKIFYSIRTKLTGGENKLRIPYEVAEYFCYYAQKEKAMMLCGFSTMLYDATLFPDHHHIQDHHIQWIHQQLKEYDDPNELILGAEYLIRQVDARVLTLLRDKDVQSELDKQKKQKIKCLEKFQNEFEKIIQNDFQDDGIDKMVLAFEELKCKMSCAEKLLETLAHGLTRRIDTYCETLCNVGNRFTISILEREFKKLLSDEDSEGDLAKEWSEVTEGMRELDKIERKNELY
ncbi:hypothetical protein MKW94_009206 [Papaver nudicaule]|uniref:Uncharacterized protein n=1 Tax=Papaver nudicaule TaxID=74823 RepID=A0AA41S8L8_PAPNU|nr:hypothetical protein [Papaver nudicaule]